MKRPSLRARIAVAGLAFLVAFVAAEALYRVARFGTRGLSPAGIASCAPIGHMDALRASEVEGLSYELRPNLDLTFKFVPLRTNARGLREDDEVEVAKPPGTYRIVFLGDSFTFGSGVAIEDVYHSVVERALAAEHEGLRVECLNFGVAGYGLNDYAMVLKHKALRFAPDLVVVGLTPNDLRPQGPEVPTFVPKEPLEMFWRSHLVSDLVFGSVYGPEEDPDALESDPETQQRYVTTRFRRLATFCRGRCDLVLLSLRMDAEDSDAERTFRAAAAELGIDYLDAGPHFPTDDPGQFYIYPADRHPNAAANAIYARVLLERIRAAYPPG